MTTRSLSAGSLTALDALLTEIGLAPYFTGDASLDGDDVLIRSPHRLVEAVSTAQLLMGCAVSAIWQQRTGASSDVAIDSIEALHSLHTAHFVWQQGAYMEVGAEYVPANGLFPSSDGRHILLCAGPPYMKLLNGYLDFFGCANKRESFAKATQRYTATELEDGLAEAGVPACRVFDRAEWLAHPQGRLLAATPVIEIEKIADGAPVPFASGPPTPLSGLRVLDFTHVLAGPHSTQSLAEFGADVLHISSPAHSDTLPQHLGVDMGKYCAYLDLTQADQHRRMLELTSDADVFVSSYRTSVAQRYQLTPAELAAQSKNGIVALSINAYGHDGPWQGRPGFDPNGQAASGFAATEGGSVQTPNVSPVSYLADTISGYLAAAGVMAALVKRAAEGGSYHVKVSLTRSSMWVEEFGTFSPQAIEDVPPKDIYPYRPATARTAFGAVTTLANPLQFSSLTLPHNQRLVPYGADLPEWP